MAWSASSKVHERQETRTRFSPFARIGSRRFRPFVNLWTKGRFRAWYVADAVSGLLTVLLRGQKGEAYNVADPSSDVALKELAKIIADKTGNETVFDVPKDEEAAGYSKATKARMNGRKLMDVGWSPRYNIRSGLERTIDILREVGGSGFVSH